MKNYMDFNAFRKDVNAALAEVSKKYGISIEAGNISYDNASFTLKLMGKRADVDVDKMNFDRDVHYMQGLTEDDYGRQVKMNGKDFTIIGLKPGNKYSVICERSDGKKFVLTKDSILLALGRTL